MHFLTDLLRKRLMEDRYAPQSAGTAEVSVLAPSTLLRDQRRPGNPFASKQTVANFFGTLPFKQSPRFSLYVFLCARFCIFLFFVFPALSEWYWPETIISGVDAFNRGRFGICLYRGIKTVFLRNHALPISTRSHSSTRARFSI
jgi:hypothetical protein